jgi:hypothetical protein
MSKGRQSFRLTASFLRIIAQITVATVSAAAGQNKSKKRL